MENSNPTVSHAIVCPEGCPAVACVKTMPCVRLVSWLMTWSTMTSRSRWTHVKCLVCALICPPLAPLLSLCVHEQRLSDI